MEALTSIGVSQVVQEFPLLLGKVEKIRVAAGKGTVERFRLARDRLTRESPGLTDFQTRIDRAHAIEAPGELPVGEQHADIRLFPEFPLQACDSDHGVILT